MLEKILVHTCCAPCLAFLYSELKYKFEIIAYFYNPNIHPFKEYKNRKNALIEFCRINSIKLIIKDNDDYNFEDWFEYIYYKQNEEKKDRFFLNIKNNRDFRCKNCYEFRLLETVNMANNLGIKKFTTTLLYSIYQNHEFLKNSCYELSKKNSLDFYYEDFRKGWQKGFDLYNETGLYKQNYCGCIFSENERFNKKFKVVS